MSSNQVGFAFQADVVGGSSLIYSASHRLLKSLSDGGIDAYAIAACVDLGRTLPITASQEMTVSRLLASRRTRAGYIAKVLQIGWGHADVAIELSRTRAGTAVLLLVNALATGGTVFDAAVALQQLLILNGCERDMLPNVDMVLAMVRYLAPMLYDSGFRDIFQQIYTAIAKAAAVDDNVETKWNSVGDPSQWTQAVKQFIFTAERKENLYLYAKQRGPWLAALAVHVLGMACKVKTGDLIVWESAGTQGSVIIQLSSLYPETKDSSWGGKFSLEAPMTDQQSLSLSVEYPMNLALQAAFDIEPRITKDITALIHSAIYRIALRLAGSFCITWSETRHSATSLNKNLILQACHHLGIYPSSESVTIYTFDLRYSWLQELTIVDFNMLERICGQHSEAISSISTLSGVNIGCLCSKVDTLIHRGAVTVLALAQCHYNPQELRIHAGMFTGQISTLWMESLTPNHAGSPKEVELEGNGRSETVQERPILPFSQLLSHLSHLFHGADLAFQNSTSPATGIKSNILAVSLGHITIYHKLILDNECFTKDKQFVAISTGRLTMDKVLRTFVKEPCLREDLGSEPNGRGKRWKPPQILRTTLAHIAPGLDILPHYAEGDARPFLNATLTEDAIQINCFVISRNEDHKAVGVPIDLCYCIATAMSCDWPDLTMIEDSQMDHGTIYEECGHEQGRPLKAEITLGKFAIAPFCGHESRAEDQDTFIIYALKGRGLEQLIQTSFLNPKNTFLQLGRCLTCTCEAAGDKLASLTLPRKRKRNDHNNEDSYFYTGNACIIIAE